MALFVAFSMGRLTSFRHTVGLGDRGSAAEFINRNVATDHAPVLIRSQMSSIHTFLKDFATRNTGRFLVASFTGPSPMEPMLFFIIG